MADLQLIDQLAAYVQATADTPVDYRTHDCGRWVAGWAASLGFKSLDFPYLTMEDAVRWFDAFDGGPMGAAEHMATELDWEASEPVCGSIVCVQPGAIPYFGISENGWRHVILNDPVGVRRVALPVQGAWSAKGGF